MNGAATNTRDVRKRVLPICDRRRAFDTEPVFVTGASRRAALSGGAFTAMATSRQQRVLE
jgi:hypothetical protein